MGRYCTTILLGAFLLFQVQPQIARTILPWFGGGPAVWSTCLVFFQVALVLGYAYAHVLSRTPRRVQIVLHLGLLLASIAVLPVAPADTWKPTGVENPTLYILALLTRTVGGPYVLLAATGPLLQSWFAREFRGQSPYRLYALSNIGSLSALLSFPFLFEPNFTLGLQAELWMGLYLTFIALCVWCGVRSFCKQLDPPRLPVFPGEAGPMPSPGAIDPDPVPEQPQPRLAPEFRSAAATATAVAEPAVDVAPAEPKRLPTRPLPVVANRPTVHDRLSWIALGALPTVMLMAVTNTICRDLAVVPFLWVMPLSVYLVTFILTFDSERWYRPSLMVPMLGLSAAAVLTLAPTPLFIHTVELLIAATVGCLFFTGMVCHGELVRKKPHALYLTGFYLSISVGGAIGGMFVALLAPMLFNAYYEFEIGLVAAMITAVWAIRRLDFRSTMLRRAMQAAMVLIFVAGIGGAVYVRVDTHVQNSTSERNFFGQLTLTRNPVTLQRDGRMYQAVITSLSHGQTVHGRQLHGAPEDTARGMTYYWPQSGVAYAVTQHPAAGVRPLRVGVIGLGAGTLAHYAKDGDHYTFYEIDPAMERLAESEFTYLRDARKRGAKVDVVLGDARIMLERQLGQVQEFDVLVVDAFSSDAIPVHLLTRECREIYLQHLAAGGVLCFHITNRHLDLAPVIRGLAGDAGLEARFVYTERRDIGGNISARWALVTDNAEILDRAEMQTSPSRGAQKTLLWTDTFSSLWHVWER